jgi:HlyD family secretion protein
MRSTYEKEGRARARPPWIGTLVLFAMSFRWLAWVGVLVIVAAGGVGFWRYRNAHQPPPVTYQTVALGRRHVVGRVTATGTLLATVTVQVGTQVSGRVQKLFVDYNSPVKKGQVVAKIDPLLFQATLEQARANLASAKAALKSSTAQADLAARQFEREKALLQDHLAAQQDVDTSESNARVTASQVDVAVASLAQAQAQLHQAETNLSYTDIVSPIDGTVISRAVDVGQTVAASLQAPVLFTIAEDLRKMQVNTNVSEGDVGRLEPGMTAFFTVDAYPGARFRGTISQIRNAATTVSNVVTYDAVIDVDNSDMRLRPGMTANATVIYAEKRDVLAVANAALRFRPPAEANVHKPAPSASTEAHEHRWRDGAGASGDRPEGGGWAGHGEGREGKSVWKLVGGEPVQVPVKTGLSDGAYTELTGEELAEGDLVIVDATMTGKETVPLSNVLTGGGGPGGGGGGGGGRRPF